MATSYLSQTWVYINNVPLGTLDNSLVEFNFYMRAFAFNHKPIIEHRIKYPTFSYSETTLKVNILNSQMKTDIRVNKQGQDANPDLLLYHISFPSRIWFWTLLLEEKLRFLNKEIQLCEQTFMKFLKIISR